MFLKSLTLKGFKSFAEPTTLEIEPGVTVVVGPNGSGKSNVVDAIAWVLGAQAPRSVRSQKMDDVIFAGTAKRPALGRAEVTITIDNSDGTLGVEFSEVTITRTLFRTGESDYAINGVPCRLLDVQELLSDAGVGRQQHVIVSQGQIDAVLNARPEERRAIIEEAAGVLKYRRRKEKAERRLDATEANLLRVQDLLREVRRQLRPLERQAKAAERHGELIGEVTELRTFVAGREIAGLRSTLEVLAGTRHETSRDEAELKATLTRLDTTIIGLEAELSASGESDLGDRVVRVEQLRERARGLALVLAERRRSIERDRGQLLDAGVVASLEADGARASTELETVAADREALGPEVDQLALDEEALDHERESSLNSTDTGQATARAASAAAEVRGELRSIRAALQRAEAELARTIERAVGTTDRLVAAQDRAERFREELRSVAEIEQPLVAAVESVEVELVDAIANVATRQSERNHAAENASRWAARVEALQMALDSARARAGAERLAGVDGVLGTLLDLIEIDEGWEGAVEAALGESLTAVVVADPDAARRALAELRGASTDGAVLALGARSTAAPRTTVGSPVRPHVRSGRPGVSNLLDSLLAASVRVDGVHAALDAALANPELVVVTSDGDRFGLHGWRIGVAGSGATAAALDDARTNSAHAAEALDDAVGAANDADEQLADVRGREESLAGQLEAHDARFTTATEGLSTALGEQRELQAELDTLAITRAEVEQNIAREQSRVAELDALLPALEGDEAAEADAALGRDRVRAELDVRAAMLGSRRRDLEIRQAALDERHASLTIRLHEIEERLTTNDAARQVAETRRVQLGRSLDVLDQLVALVEGRRAQIEHQHAALAERRRQQSDAVRAVASALEGNRRDRHEAERALDVVRERSRRAELDEAEAKLRLENSVETLRRELDIEPATAEAAPMPELPEGASPAGRLRELDRELKLLGPINPLALEEFNELQTRSNFLEEQVDDVRSTRRELSRVIAAIDGEIQNVFAAAFADVSANFSQLFSMLFPGGVGALTLTTPDDLLNTGIEVEAKPSGKNVKKLSLLSGGERSLTALAYLFAVFRSRPSPFYVMDEVEAALDDVNLHRFLSLIAEFRKDAQLIIVSHQKRTMEAGDSLLGVSMQPGGSSRVVTERVAASA